MMNDREILDAIEEHFLSVRRIPLETVSVYEGHHRDRHPDGETILRDVKRKIDGKYTSVKAEYVRVVTVPKFAGWYMCQSLAGTTRSCIDWNRKEHNLAPSLSESIGLYLESLSRGE